RLVRAAEPTGDAEPAALALHPPAHAYEAIGEQMQPLLRRDAGEIADGQRWAVVERALAAVAFQVESGIHDFDPLSHYAQVVCHEVGVVAARGDEAGRRRAVRADERDRLLPMRGWQRVEKNVVALQIGPHWHAEPLLDLGN